MMKKGIIYIALLAGASIFLASCEKFLDEEPKSSLTAKYLESAEGVNSALNSAYSDLRYLYGTEATMNATCAGTDEWQLGPGGNPVFNNYESSMASNGAIGGIWNWGYTDINTANAVIDNAAASGLTEEEANQAIAEAKYIRATWYFMIVQLWGDCPLNLNFITVPSTEAYRAPSADVYNAIIADLDFAKATLPAKARETGRVDAAAATHLLAKVYLTRATRSFGGGNADYQKAYDNAMELINNASAFGLELLKDFADVHAIGNERNNEIIFTVEKNANKLYNDAGDPSDGVTGYKADLSAMLFRPNYPTWLTGKGLIRSIQYGRPWHRVRPTNYLLEKVFANRVDDTRYDKSFQTVWKVNDPANVADPSFLEGDTAVWLPGVENPRSARAILIFKPSQYYANNGQTASIYPSLCKFDDHARPAMNESSVRPFIVYHFSETYLIAAEAAMYLNNASKAKDLVNVIRARAAFNVNRSDAENVLSIMRMKNSTPEFTNLDEGINFILDERSRELCGEMMRWLDLVRTKTTAGEVMLLNRIRNLDPAVPGKDNIKDFHLLRPIPQSQMDLTSNEFLNNPGY
jgi:hypothetical protein